MTTIVEQNRAQSARSSNLRGARSSRGEGSWRPPTRPSPARYNNIWGLICYRYGIKGHVVKDCPMPWVDKCYRCGQSGHIAKNCTQGPAAASSVGSAVSGSKGTTEGAQQGSAITPKSRAQD